MLINISIFSVHRALAGWEKGEESDGKANSSVLLQLGVGRRGKTPNSAFPFTVLRGFLDVFLPLHRLEWRDMRSVADHLKPCCIQFQSSCNVFVYCVKEASSLVSSI